jgi:integrase
MTMTAQKISILAQTNHNQTILNFILAQRKEGRADETIRSRVQALNQVAKTTDLDDPEQVKEYLANSKWSNNTKIKFVDTYTTYLKFLGKTWNPPRYMATQKLPFIPTEQEIDLLIAGTGKILSAILQTLKETGIRIGELTQLTPLDLDTERKTLSITPEKGSNPRILPISDKLITMLKNLPKDPRATYKTLFQPHKDTLRDYLCNQRKAIAKRLNNPRLKEISFHTLRHWKGTTEYHKTKDIIHVKTVLGHKSITSTLIYINLESALYLTTSDEWTCKAAHNPQEELELIEAGFQHVNNRGTLAFYKKRK